MINIDRCRRIVDNCRVPADSLKACAGDANRVLSVGLLCEAGQGVKADPERGFAEGFSDEFSERHGERLHPHRNGYRVGGCRTDPLGRNPGGGTDPGKHQNLGDKFTSRYDREGPVALHNPERLPSLPSGWNGDHLHKRCRTDRLRRLHGCRRKWRRAVVPASTKTRE